MPIIDFDDPYAQIIRPRSRRSSQNRPRRIDMPMPTPIVSVAQAKIGQQRKRTAKKIRDQHAPLDGSGTRALLAVWDRRPDAVELATVALHNAKAAAFRNAQALTHVEAWQSVLSDLTAGV
jgi:hypothetical protein